MHREQVGKPASLSSPDSSARSPLVRLAAAGLVSCCEALLDAGAAREGGEKDQVGYDGVWP